MVVVVELTQLVELPSTVEAVVEVVVVVAFRLTTAAPRHQDTRLHLHPRLVWPFPRHSLPRAPRQGGSRGRASEALEKHSWGGGGGGSVMNHLLALRSPRRGVPAIKAPLISMKTMCFLSNFPL